MTAAVDQARSVREEDQLDIGKVDCISQAACRRPAWRADNLAVSRRRIQPHVSDHLRRARAGAASAAGRRQGEIRARRAARGARHGGAEATLFAACPILAMGDDPATLGYDFYVMERLHGIILRRDLPSDIGLDAAGVRQLCKGFIDRWSSCIRSTRRCRSWPAWARAKAISARQVGGWSDRWRKALERRHRRLRRRARLARRKTARRAKPPSA